MSSSTVTTEAPIPDDALFEALVFCVPREVCRAAKSCRHWHQSILGESSATGPFWKSLFRTSRPNIFNDIEGIEKSMKRNGGNTTMPYKELVLGAGQLPGLVETELRKVAGKKVDKIRSASTLYHTEYGTEVPRGLDLSIPRIGTTATSLPDANGVYSEPVYYDWERNWLCGDNVSMIFMEEEKVQKLTRGPIDSIEKIYDDGYAFMRWGWNEEHVWPFFINRHPVFGCGDDEVDDVLINLFTPPERMRELNDLIANNFEAFAKEEITAHLEDPKAIMELVDELLFSAVIEHEGSIDCNFGDVIRHELQHNLSGIMSNCDTFNFMEESVFQGVQAKLEEISSKMMEVCLRNIFKADGPLRSLLLYSGSNFLANSPIWYQLAKLLSPPGTQLQVIGNIREPVVMDVQRNIIFHENYFKGITAADTMRRAMEKSEKQPLSKANIFYITTGKYCEGWSV